jgi:hypothetical protein
MGFANLLLGIEAIVILHKNTLDSKVPGSAIRESPNNVGTLTVIEVNTLQVEAKTPYHIAKRQRETILYIIPMTKGKTIQ